MLIDLSHLGLIEVSGEGAKKLLQGQTTCQLDEITANQTRLAAHCNPQGRIISLFRLFYFNDTYFLQMPIEIIAQALAALKKYAMFYKVNLVDASNSLKQFVLHETELRQLSETLPEKIDSAIELENFLVIKISKEFYQIVGKPEHLEKFKLLPIDTDSENSWKKIQIENGIPTIYKETIEKLLPHEINLHHLNAISFEKGCYTGQEIIARMHYRGQLKKLMYVAKVETSTPPIPGNDIYTDEKSCGTVVDSFFIDKDTYGILVIANKEDKETKQLFLDPDKITSIDFSLS